MKLIAKLFFFLTIQYITNTGKNMVFRTNKDAPNYRIVVINLENLKNPNWDTLIKVMDK